MKIIQFIDSLNVGGSERMSVNIANALKLDGHDVIFVVSRESGDLERKIINDIPIFYLNKHHFLDLKSFNRLIKLIRKFKPDILHAHSSSIYWGSIAKMILLNPYELIFHDHYGMSDKLTRINRFPLKLVSFLIDKVITVNDKLKSWCIDNLNVKLENIVYIPNFPYLNMPHFKYSKDFIQILYLANLRPQKDHHTLISAFSLLSTFKFEKSLKLIFAGSAINSIYKSEIYNEITTKGLSDVITIIGSTKNVESLLMESDIGVLSSISEGLPVSLLEYGLAGLPVVVTDVGQCAKVLNYGQFGIIVPPKSPYIFAESLKKIILNLDYYKNIGVEFKCHIEENYGVEKFLSQYYKLLAC